MNYKTMLAKVLGEKELMEMNVQTIKDDESLFYKLVDKNFLLIVDWSGEDRQGMLYNFFNNRLQSMLGVQLVVSEDEVYQKYISMYNAAKKEDLYLIITSAYRDYNFQDQLWNQYAKSQGEEWADSVAARAGHSEHQTGLTLDIVTYNSNMNEFENTDEFKWLQKHAHEYGFIMRYPKDKEDITGYDYESWHYRYVGVETATKIHELGITYDEYYAYYLAD